MSMAIIMALNISANGEISIMWPEKWQLMALMASENNENAIINIMAINSGYRNNQ